MMRLQTADRGNYKKYYAFDPYAQAYPQAGTNARYVLMDNWVTMPSNVCKMREFLDVIGMVQKMPKVCYAHEGKSRNLMEIY